MEKAIFAGGCFWCTQHAFAGVPGIEESVVGFIGGHSANPTYEEVCAGVTGHVEALSLTFDPEKISYAALLQIYWHSIDPTQAEGQFCDIGTQYQPIIFYTSDAQKKAAFASQEAMGERFSSVHVDIRPATLFYPASQTHQHYAQKHPEQYQRYEEASGRKERLRELWGPEKVMHTKKKWKELLSEEQYYVLRMKGTEPPFDNAYHDCKREGLYRCAGCGLPLFTSESKYDSKTGWPSFFAPLEEGHLLFKKTEGAEEVLCARCEGHLGHHFYDGPEPTNERYCINSAALQFTTKEIPMTTVTFKGKKIKIEGKLPSVGEKAPSFTLVNADLENVSLQSFAGKKKLLNVFISLDTSVCATSVHTFHKEAAKNPQLVLLNISADLPFAAGRFCKAEKLGAITLSTFRSSFARDYGLLIGEGALQGLSARAVFVLDEKEKVLYSELVGEITSEPNYTAALRAAGN